MRTQIHTADQPDSDITAFVLSCDRLDLLAATMSSFLATVGENAKLVIYDDSARPDIFQTLVESYGDKADVICFPENRGQWVAYDFMSSYCFTKYIFYVEDDWEFLAPGYMQLSKKILEQNPLIGNVDLAVQMGAPYGCVGEETEDFFWKKPWRLSENHLYWIGWQGSPNLKRREDYIRLGRIETCGPEWVVDRKFHLMGLKSVISKTPYVRHLGDYRSRMDGKRPVDQITPCRNCTLNDVCKLPRIDWYYMENSNGSFFA